MSRHELYLKHKANAREDAIEWQLSFNNSSHYMSELVDWSEHFYKLGKRFGLLREFKENGIC